MLPPTTKHSDRLLHILAATASDIDPVQHRLAIYPGAVHELGADNDLPIHRACLNKSASCHKIVRLLLAQAPDSVRRRGRDDALPLHMACANTSNCKVVKDLVAMYPGAATFVTSRGDLPLHHACLNQTPAALEILKYVIIPNVAALMHAGTHGDLPLHVSCAVARSSAVVRELISQDCRALRIRNRLGDLPIHRACLNQGPDAARILAQVSARTHPVATGVPLYPEAVKTAGQGGNYALHLACGNSNSVHVVKALVEAWPEACMETNDDGNYPVHCCCMNRHSHVVEDILKVLMAAVPDSLELKGWKSCLPLHIAAEFSGSLDAVRLLIAGNKYGTFTKTENGELPVECAQRNRTPSRVQIREELFKAYPDAYGEKDPAKLHLQVKSLTDNFFPWDEPVGLMTELRATLAGEHQQGGHVSGPQPEQKSGSKEQKPGMKLPDDSSIMTGRWWTAGLTSDHTCTKGQLTRAAPHGIHGFLNTAGNPVRHSDVPHPGSEFCVGHCNTNQRSGKFVKVPSGLSKTPAAAAAAERAGMVPLTLNPVLGRPASGANRTKSSRARTKPLAPRVKGRKLPPVLRR
eukprot:TRINITY_DN3579_c0_g2_i1.p1 TRINITY_DN3579_c0_g2~~TRINITY_DN3579_c0_g2_i1.p1  ORF type:complete len:578 (-),score=100.74 TRINITY_DN3579_c0_g2_i1:263-1996(-)